MRQPKLTDEEKQQVIDCTTHKTCSITELANYLKVHPRTIYRVLEEAGVHVKKEAPVTRVMALLAKHHVTVDQLEGILDRRTAYRKNVAALFHPAPTVGASH